MSELVPHERAAGPLTILGLQDGLMARLRSLAAGYWRLESKGEPRPATVIDGWLPPKQADVDDFPFLIVRPRQGTDGEDDARATFEIVVGTYSDTDDGWRDAMLLVEAIRQDLGAAPVIGAFECVRPLTWQLGDEQQRPQWVATVTTTWIVPLPVRVEARGPGSER